METKNYQRLVKYLYENSVNTSRRVVTKPKDDENIIESADISLINLGVDRIKKEIFVRVQFLGSQKFYQYHVHKDDAFKWYTAMFDMGYLSSSSPFEEDKDSDIW